MCENQRLLVKVSCDKVFCQLKREEMKQLSRTLSQTLRVFLILILGENDHL